MSKPITVELTEEETLRIVYALGLHTGRMLESDPNQGRQLFQKTQELVKKITLAKIAAAK